MRADLDELMHDGKAAQYRVIAHLYVSGQLRVIGEDGVVAHLTIVRQMHICHDPIVIPHAGDTDILRGTQIKSAKLADYIVVTNFQSGRFI